MTNNHYTQIVGAKKRERNRILENIKRLEKEINNLEDKESKATSSLKNNYNSQKYSKIQQYNNEIKKLNKLNSDIKNLYGKLS